MTIILAALHAFKTNKSFEPEGLYIFTAMLDISLLSEFL